MMDPEIKKAFEAEHRRRDPWDSPPYRLCETGIAYEAKWVRDQYDWFAAGYRAAAPKVATGDYCNDECRRTGGGIGCTC